MLTREEPEEVVMQVLKDIRISSQVPSVRASSITLAEANEIHRQLECVKRNSARNYFAIQSPTLKRVQSMASDRGVDSGSEGVCNYFYLLFVC